MVLQNFKLIFIIFLILSSSLLVISIKYRRKFWNLYATLMPFLFAVLVITNMVLFPYLNQAQIHPSYEGSITLLPSNDLFSLLQNCFSPPRESWVYPLVENYFKGRTLLIPIDVKDSLDLSFDRLIQQGQLAEIQFTEFGRTLSRIEVEHILGLKNVVLDTLEGDIYYFVIEESDVSQPLLLLKIENQIILISQNLIPKLETDL